jgi:HEPN domain-containing protein
MFDVEKQIAYWKSGAEDDIDTATILIINGKLVQGLFFCHLCIEKISKALVVKNCKEIPPKSHDIFYLSNKAGIELPETIQAHIQVLMKFQLEGRYPEYYPKSPAFEIVQKYLAETQNLLQWFKKML